MLPCPLCGDGLRAANLERHLDKAHAGASADDPDPFVVARWIGVDRASLVVVAALIALMALLILSTPLLGGLGLALIGLVNVAMLLLLGLSLSDRLLARLELGPEGLRLRYCFGLLGRSIPAIRRVEVGRLKVIRPNVILSSYVDDYGENFASREVDAGWYLRLHGAGAVITVGCPKGTGFRKHWAGEGLTEAANRRWWDITLDRSAMVGLEYSLVEAGLLEPR